MSGPSDIVLFLGRLHPLLVHLPIGLIVLLALLEFLARFRRFKSANANSGLILAVTVPAAIFTVTFGWLLSLAGGYEVHLLQWHKWTGIGTAVACAVAGLLYSLELKRAYRICLFSSFAALVVTSHFGGSLTHGSDYLVRYAPPGIRKWLVNEAKIPAPPVKPSDPTARPLFSAAIQPILEKDCVSCHGPDKQKAKLRLDSLAAALQGSEHGPVIVAGKSAESELIKRLKLDVSSDDHMPPDGKPQPDADDINLLAWWIDAGAPGDKNINELKPPPPIARVLQARLSPAAPVRQAQTVAPQPLDQLQSAVAQLTADLGIAINPVAQTDAWLQCNASVAGTNFGDAQLSRLAPLAANLRWLDLAGTRVSDASIPALAGMANLQRLHLERTAITDAALKPLATLPELEYLNLYGTAVTDTGLAQLQTSPKLKEIFLWQTQVTSTGAQAFAEARTDKAQIQIWQDEIEQLKSKIRGSQIDVELGTPVAAVTAATNATPFNLQCPVSGKPIDPTKTVIYQGKLLAFCCDDCKAKFEKDPKPILAKLGLTNTPPAAVGGH